MEVMIEAEAILLSKMTLLKVNRYPTMNVIRTILVTSERIGRKNPKMFRLPFEFCWSNRSSNWILIVALRSAEILVKLPIALVFCLVFWRDNGTFSFALIFFKIFCLSASFVK